MKKFHIQHLQTKMSTKAFRISTEGRGKIGLVQRADKFRKSYEPLKCRNILFRLSNDNNLKRILLEYLSISLSKFL